MPAQPASFRDFGILPENLQPPVRKVRAFLSPGRIAGQYLATAIVLGIGLLGMGLTAWFLPTPLNYLGALAEIVGFGVFAYLGTRNDYGWVELDGDVIRAQHLYTGRALERKVQEIERMVTVVHQGGNLQAAMVQELLGVIKGMEIKFRDKRTPLRILRADPAMTNSQELLQAILFRMSEIDELEADIGDVSGVPLVRNIHWKHEEPVKHPNEMPFHLAACLVIFLGVLMGPIFGCVAEQQRDLLEVSLQQPHELTLAELIEKGPGENRHVTVTNFVPGGYVVEETKQGTWTSVWVAMFPAGRQQNEIKVVYSPKGISSEAMLRQRMAQQKITGACSETLRTSWGVTGPELSKSNGGAPLKAAWDLGDLSNPPTRATVNYLYLAAYASFALVLLLSLIVYGKAILANVAA